MGGEIKKPRQTGNRFLVGVKLDGTGTELLTWTLAKYAEAGDRVIALHTANPSSQAGLLKTTSNPAIRQAESCLNSLTGAFKSLLSIKEVDLQVTVADGPSLKQSLIEECKKCNATKLILGHATQKPHVGHSFSLAKYCSRRLPSTCSVVVIEHGQITFEKGGSLKGDGNNSLGVLTTLQKTLRNRSWKNSGHHLTEERKVDTSITCLEAEMGPNEYGNAPCPWPFPSRFLDSPISVLHPCKLSSFHKRALGPLDSPISVLSPAGELGTAQKPSVVSRSINGNVENYQERKVLRSRQSLEECFAFAEKVHIDYLSSSNELDKAASLQSIEANSWQSISIKNNEKSCSLPMRSDSQTDQINRQETAAESHNQPSVGWPLLHKHLARSHRLSVIEWAMQLPDRSKEEFYCQAELLGTDYQNTVLPICSKSMGHEQQRTEKISNAFEVNHFLQATTDALRFKLANLSWIRPCKEFQLKELQAATNFFDSEKLVGRGGCSQVYQGMISKDCKIAVKCLNLSAIDSEDAFATEVEIMSSVCHNHIVQLIGYCVDSEHRMLVYNFASQGSLEQMLHSGKGKAVLPWESRFQIAVGVANALIYLHDHGMRRIIHRDVKSSNILLLADLQPQLTDFGLAKRMPESSTQITCSDVVGTFGYLAPEYFMFGKVSEKTDVYSFGVVLLELITGRRPIDNRRPKGEENLVAWARLLWEGQPSAETIVDPELGGSYDFVQLKNVMIAASVCLQQSPQMRPRMSKVIKLLRGEVENLEHFGRQNSVGKELDDGCDMPNYGEIDIRTHLNLALFGLDDDAASQASIEHSVSLAHTNRYLEEYLGGRYSRSNSFE